MALERDLAISHVHPLLSLSVSTPNHLGQIQNQEVKLSEGFTQLFGDMT